MSLEVRWRSGRRWAGWPPGDSVMRFAATRADAALPARYELGGPLAQGTTLGPMAAVRFADAVRAHTREALAKGARPLIDAKSFAADRAGTAYLMPQVLV